MKHAMIILLLFLGWTTTKAATPEPEQEYQINCLTDFNDYGQIVWYNLVTPNLEKSIEFYDNIFDWTFEKIDLNGQKFAIIRHDKKPVGSMLEIPEANGSVWLASVSVSDIDEAVARITKNGGRLLIEPFDIMDSGKQVIVEGPQGEKMAYINNPAAPVSTLKNAPNRWIWTELWSNDLEQSKTFYKNVWNVSINDTEIQNRPYVYLEKEGKKVAGMISNPSPGAATQWVPYLNMKDITALHAKLKALNVNVMLAPQEDDASAIIVFQDPYGATLAAQNYAN